ncbi:aminotransferase class V-fold PLP-dependent enzyme (plasmid) [Agrobacterium fabrum]|uniref:trans-sulfuration enzyme family protein n=1 Tax=Agrobacterium fabrum TaxID=1176649 RepID=UPI0021CF0D79|nr:PLP-dependent transferase [Agrobacterium fabrum]UXT61239.1 aminotransferase class V-fold PLP-dependent enzyme [Agrobacterium fabrum]
MSKDGMSGKGPEADLDLGFATRAILGGSGREFQQTTSRASVQLCGRHVSSRVADDMTTMGPQEALAANLAGLESAEAGLVLGSGLMAFTALVRATSSPGDRVLVQKSACTATTALLQATLQSLDVEMAVVDVTAPSDLEDATTERTHLVYFETPSNPLNNIVDISDVAVRAHALGLIVAVDSTFASPVLQRPIEHGGDVVLHSLTKYINGHGDTMGGALLGSHELIARVRAVTMRGDPDRTPLSLDATGLILRGLKTLALRMDRHSSSAHGIALTLEAHPAVKWVRYPFLSSHPESRTATRQMSAGSGMVAFGLHAGDDTARAVQRLRLFRPATTFGEVGSLICTSADLASVQQISLEGTDLCSTLGRDVIRLSVGLEDAEDLIEDLWQALSEL